MTLERARMGRAARRKGGAGELAVCKLMHTFGWERARRNFGSGSAGGNDIVDGPEGTAWEVKCVEALNIHKAFEQASLAARPTETPVVAFKRSRGPWLACLPLDDLLELLAHRERA